MGTIGVARIIDWGSCELSPLNLFIREISHNSQFSVFARKYFWTAHFSLHVLPNRGFEKN